MKRDLENSDFARLFKLNQSILNFLYVYYIFSDNKYIFFFENEK